MSSKVLPDGRVEVTMEGAAAAFAKRDDERIMDMSYKATP